MRSTVYRDGRSNGALAGLDRGTYATPRDFCAIFTENTDSLYSLALVLTVNHETAQQCFLAALEDCQTSSGVFREWAGSWSRRAIIKNAIRLSGDARKNNNGAREPGREAIAEDISAAARFLVELRPLDRFAFVLSVLEGYSLRESAALLGASPREMEQARIRAFEQIGGDNRGKAPASYNDSSCTEQNSFFTLQ
jgi:DNA-directed RNA polymerase specialized sigma24 family protein